MDDKIINSVKRGWIRSASIYWLVILFEFGFASCFAWNIPSALDETMVSGLATLSSFLICYFVIWVCAYRKPGTKFIGYWCFMSVIQTLRNLVDLKFIFDLPGNIQVIFILFLIIDLVSFIYLWVNTHRLWSLNGMIKKRRDLCA